MSTKLEQKWTVNDFWLMPIALISSHWRNESNWKEFLLNILKILHSDYGFMCYWQYQGTDIDTMAKRSYSQALFYGDCHYECLILEKQVV